MEVMVRNTVQFLQPKYLCIPTSILRQVSFIGFYKFNIKILFIFLCESLSASESDTHKSKRETVLDEFKRYMQEPLTNWRVNNVMEWWSDNQVKFPHVALMALKYLAIPASSAPLR